MEVWIAFLLLDSFLKPTYLFPVKQQFLQVKKIYIYGEIAKVRSGFFPA